VFIVWGRKIKRQMLGFVADFCPLCRKSNAFKLERIGSARHVYYISFGEGELVGYERTCIECGTPIEAVPSSYSAVAERLAPLGELKYQTYPSLDQVVADRMFLEERIRREPQSFSEPERYNLIMTSFFLIAPKVERHFASTRIDKGLGLGILGALALLIVVPAFIGAFFPDDDPGGLLLGFIAAIGVLVWQARASSRRFMNREIVPQLAKALAPFKPTEAELERHIKELKKLKQKIGAKLKAKDLVQYIAAADTIVKYDLG
jgi:hypothetical protein